MTAASWSEFEQYILQIMEDEHIVGASVAVLQGDSIIYQQGFGVRHLETGAPVTPETIFGIASVSKSFTALVIAQLADEGKLSVDDPVVKHLPDFRLKGVADMEAIRISHLLSHTTGLPPMKRQEDLAFFIDHIDCLSSVDCEMLGAPGEYFSYCNDTFLLLGAIIEGVTGRLYRRVMTERILEALAMHRSTYSLEEVEKFPNATTPYIYDRDEGVHKEASWPGLGTYEVGGGVRSNVVDLMKYGQLYVNRGSFRGSQLVSLKGLHRMMQPVHRVDRNSHYGFALRTTPDYHGVTLVEHGGGQPGVSSNFGFIPERQIAVAVLANVSGVPAGDIWLAAANTALGVPLLEKRSIEPEFDLDPEQLLRFVGTYESLEGGKCRVFADTSNGSVKVEVQDQVFPVRASDQRSLVLVGKPTRNVIRFYFKDGDEKPWAAFYGSRMLTRVD